MNLVINLVTRGRPDYLKRTLERTLPNIALPTTKLMVSCDIDDLPTTTMVHHYFGSHSNVSLSIAPREDSTSAKYNRALELKPDLIGNLSDYTAITTPGFDKVIIETANLFPDGIGVVVNPMRNASFSDLYIMTKPMYEKLGYYAPPYFSYWFWDHWVDEIARRIDRMAMCDVVVEYDPRGKPPTQNLKDPAWWATWFDAAYMMRRKQAETILAAMTEPDWRKKMLIANAPLHEFRSKWINDNVRAQTRQLEGWSPQPAPEDRYVRVKDAAIAMIPGMLEGMPETEAKAHQGALTPPTVIASIPKVA